MQDVIRKHLAGALVDPWFGDIIEDFFALQGRVNVSDGGRMQLTTTTEALLDSIVIIVRHECELDRLDHLLDTHTARTSATVAQLDELIDHV